MVCPVSSFANQLFFMHDQNQNVAFWYYIQEFSDLEKDKISSEVETDQNSSQCAFLLKDNDFFDQNGTHV